MSLSSRLQGDISEIQRRRGAGYFTLRRARVLRTDDRQTDFAVEGTRRYIVGLRVEGDVLYGTCTCPYFEQTAEPCKHMWAAILEAERTGQLANASKVLSLEPDPRVFEDPDEDDDSAPVPVPQAWRRRMRDLPASAAPEPYAAGFDPARTTIGYVIYLDVVRKQGAVAVELRRKDRKRDGSWGAEKALTVRYSETEHLPDATDRAVFALLRGSDSRDWGYHSSRGYEVVANPAVLSNETARVVLPALAATGRCLVRKARGSDGGVPLRSELDPPWKAALELVRDERSGGWILDGAVEREGQKLRPAEFELLLASGVFFHEGAVHRLETAAVAPLIADLRDHGPIAAPEADGPLLAAEVLERDWGAELRFPGELRFAEVTESPVPVLRLVRPTSGAYPQNLLGRMSFRYGGVELAASDPRPSIPDLARRAFLRRDFGAEAVARDTVMRLGFRARERVDERDSWQIAIALLPAVVPPLLAAGFRVEAEGTFYRSSSSLSVKVVSGEDWFELQGAASFDGIEVPIPTLLASLRKGEPFVRLGDGSRGVLPQAWLARMAPLASMGKVDGDALRFGSRQALLLDALVAALPEVATDAAFETARRRVSGFTGIEPVSEPKGFQGELRAYQRDGLGWFRFLREFGFGGCLADDMGLGKTVQVLALLEARRRSRGDEPRASLVVAPRSVVFNWLSEAARFAPKLRVLDYTGLGRRHEAILPENYDLVVTTYGTLRRDAPALSKLAFDYVVLDEAQAIKNATSQAAKAARLLSGRHRLALTGTPIENHLGELWSLFEFLNPGMLGASPAFRAWMAGDAGTEGPGRQALARIVKPFVLRRRKDTVARELPARTEQTLWCDLGPTQRRLYDELRDHYRASLLGRVGRDGLAKSKIHVLEALLRLRQAACHPGLVDSARSEGESAKLDLLDERLSELVAEGHKALVFSQFTSLLALVRPRVDKLKGIGIAYLDGATPARARALAVKRFQEDAGCRLFLLSLKAGGLGLNLTAAGYVFLLDPWWNPAVEAQAIDRAHRIGQTKPVMAYRLVARDTVEERILSMQQTKRALADSILAGDESLIRTLTRDDLELLLG